MYTCTGGGYGNPFERKAEQVAMDVKNGFISVTQAADDYGVVIDPENFNVKGFCGGRS
jgi:N-methylhydantoinase B